MRDERGVYYHGQAGNPKVRVYVRNGKNGEIEFRLWYADFPEAWEKHGWLSYDVISRAAGLYKSERDSSANPLKIYDLAIARSLLANEKN